MKFIFTGCLAEELDPDAAGEATPIENLGSFKIGSKTGEFFMSVVISKFFIVVVYL